MFQSAPPKRILMCQPDHFEVAYVINPWMEGQFARTDNGAALRQWSRLKEIIEKRATVALQPPQRGLPDLVFTANAGLVKDSRVVVSRFRCAERQGEEKFNRLWFEENGFNVFDIPAGIHFEGAGDALYDGARDLFWVGHGFRSHEDAAPQVEALLATRAVSLALVDPRFYHLDTCLSPLPDGSLMYFPPAFDAVSRAAIEALVPEHRRIAVDEGDALKFCCNAVALDDLLIMNDASPSLQARLRQAGLTPALTPLSEFLKAGGAAKCLTLDL
jgi:N-dimethylarginine dimethylaminohydrolase